MSWSRQGFTLIELLVVISIIGLIASVVLGSLSDARSAAKYAIVQSDIRLIQNSFVATAEASLPIRLITGSGCSDCGVCRTSGLDLRSLDETNSCRTRWHTSINRIALASDLLSDGSSLYRDPWGSPYLLDENEGEVPSNPCRDDVIRSAGADGLRGTADDYIVLLPFRTQACR